MILVLAKIINRSFFSELSAIKLKIQRYENSFGGRIIKNMFLDTTQLKNKNKCHRIMTLNVIKKS
jgi:hypothetical protein